MKKEIIIIIIVCIIVAVISSFITITLMGRFGKISSVTPGDNIKTEIEPLFRDTNGEIVNNEITNLFASKEDTYTKKEIDEIISKVNICCNKSS